MPAFSLWYFAVGLFLILFPLSLIVFPSDIFISLVFSPEKDGYFRVAVRPGLFPVPIPVQWMLKRVASRSVSRKGAPGEKGETGKGQAIEHFKNALRGFRVYKDLMRQLLSAITPGIQIRRFVLNLKIGAGDAAVTALACGTTQTFLSLTLGAAQKKGLVIREPPSIRVIPDYNRTSFNAFFESSIRIKPLKMLPGFLILRKVIYRARAVEY